MLTETDEGYLEYLIELENNLQKELDLQEERERKLQAELAFLECTNSDSDQAPEQLNEVVIEVPVSQGLGSEENRSKHGKASSKKDEGPKIQKNKARGKLSAAKLEKLEDSEQSCASDEDLTPKVRMLLNDQV